MHDINLMTYRAFFVDQLSYWERLRAKETRAERIAEPEYVRMALRRARANVRQNAAFKESYPGAWVRGW